MLNCSSTRNLASISQNEVQEILCCRTELDSHADTCSVNNVAKVLENTGHVAKVSSFSGAMGTLQDIPIVKAALAYDNPDNNETPFS